jgi:beta-lactamase superfamily II metal-dependent hydrolase
MSEINIMSDADTDRSELWEHLTDLVEATDSRLSEEGAFKIVSLWIDYRRLCALQPVNAFEAALLARLHEDLCRARDRLDARARLMHDRLPQIIAAVGLDSHPGWEPGTPETALFTAVRPPRPRRVCKAHMTQWAVGQGGFWTTSGTYRNGGAHRRFELVYDCGSSTNGGLDQALSTYRPANNTIDYLFISHLDRDHTSGLETLLEKCQIDTVVMPFLPPAATVLSAARFAAHDALDDTQVRALLTDPGVYLHERGVKRVLLVQPAPEDERGEPPSTPVLEPLPSDNDLSEAIGPFRDIITRRPTGPAVQSPYQRTEVIPYASTFWLAGADRRVFWQLVPYVHPFEPLRIGRFMQSAYGLLDKEKSRAGTTSTQEALKSIISSPQGLGDLKRLYKLVRSDHNCVSMSLFSCPEPMTRSASYFETAVRTFGRRTRRIHHTSPRFGWMQTGDSTLANTAYRNAWLTHYAAHLTRVGVHVLPHHGSRHNFHRELLATNAPTVTLACAAHKNSYKHPSRTVARSARAHSTYHQVDERAQTQFQGFYADWEIPP